MFWRFEKTILSNCPNFSRKNYSKYGLESRLHFRVHSGIEVLKTDKKSKKTSTVTTTTTTTNGNVKNRVPSTINDAIDGDDDEEEFADVSSEVEQYQNDGHYGVDTLSIASSTSNGNLSAPSTARKSDVTPPTTTAAPISKMKSPKNSTSQQPPEPVTAVVVVKSTSSACSSKSASPFHTPPSTPPFLSEASSSLSPKHTYKEVGADDSPRLSKETAIWLVSGCWWASCVCVWVSLVLKSSFRKISNNLFSYRPNISRFSNWITQVVIRVLIENISLSY